MSQLLDFIISVITTAFGISKKIDSDNATAHIDVNNSKNVNNYIDQSRTNINNNINISNSESDSDITDLVFPVACILLAAVLFIKYQSVVFVITIALCIFEGILCFASIKASYENKNCVLLAISSILLIGATLFDIITVFKAVPPASNASLEYIINHTESLFVFVSFLMLFVSIIFIFASSFKIKKETGKIGISKEITLLSYALLVLSYCFATGLFENLISSTMP